MNSKNFSFVVKVIAFTFLRLFLELTNDILLYVVTPDAGKRFLTVTSKKLPAADITINLLVNFHLRVFPEKSWGIIYIFPGSSMVLSTPGIFEFLYLNSTM